MDRSGKVRKRKAETQENERLSKRLSLLNLERNGQRLYVPVEQASLNAASTNSQTPAQAKDEDIMQLDNSKHKVYIYDLDAELSDSGESDDGKLVFLPDIQKHLRENRIPPFIRANSEGELAGNNQLVLYNIPASLTVPEEQDSVRKAIIETRARARAKQDQKQNDDNRNPQSDPFANGIDVRDWNMGLMNGNQFPNQPSMGEYQGPSEIIEDDPDAMDLG
ncbi:hypothetical protein HYFRA_00003578 [Hymenoscyphus fraxineus]|uniref:Uncharacterized protein n=1 Tax=Hymenoscyphus fraxineus TaxID=746836 RepID=A0A9N9KXM6_9HELO|nr:hypothetical protein HYFRA_00003578 [Hymenoscyphus fraxineus]